MTDRKVALVAALCAVALLAPFALTPQLANAQTDDSKATASADAGRGMAAIGKAAADGKYLFVYFWRDNDEQSRAMTEVFQSTMRKWSDRTDSIRIQVGDAQEKPIVDHLDVDRAPMPLVVALASNGAITGAFPLKFDEQRLEQAFASPCMARCLKAIQGNKLVVLCVQNEGMKDASAALAGANGFKADERFSTATELITLDPTDQIEAPLLADLEVDAATSTAVTCVIAPSGALVTRFSGAVSKEQIVRAVSAAGSGCCAGGSCGPNGCCPPKK